MEFLKFRILEEQNGVIHFTTTRRGGGSEGKYSSLNLSNKVLDEPEHVKNNRSQVAETLGIPFERMLFPDQCHSDRVKEVDANSHPADMERTDGLVTRAKGVCLCILAADCVPVLLYDPVEGAIAALHAGWKGTYGRIVSRAVERMVRTWACKPEHILACIGPAISQNRYEVGDEVSQYFRLLFSDYPHIIRRNENTGKDNLDLKEANRILLHRAGVKDEHIEISPLCTYDRPDLFFSARRDGMHCGRFASGIMIC
jgi:YfiH family protein